MIKVIYRDVELLCDTPEEALQVARGVSGESSGASTKKPHGDISVTGSRWTVSRFQSFLNQLKENQRKFLSLLVNSPDGVTDTQLRQTLGLTTNKAFGPILSGISKKAKKSGISLQDILSSDKVQLSADETVLEFKSKTAFAQIAREAGGIK
jgi:hypothetical protein